MKNLVSVLAILAMALVVTPLTFAADAQSTNAVVLKVKGVALAQIPGKAEPVQITENQALPAGTVITTGSSGEVYLQPFSGTVTTIKPNSELKIETLSETKSDGVVTKQKSLLNLKSGNVVSNIDPAKKGVNDYSVRTPKGVAAARGTAYAVSVAGGDTTVAATADTVTFTTAAGTVYSVQAGMVSITPAGGEPQPPVALAAAMANDSTIATMLNSSVQTLAAILEGNLGDLSAESATNLAAQLVAVASAANPGEAAAYTSTLVTAIASANSSMSTSSEATATAVAAVTAAAVTAAPAQASAIASAAVTAAPQQAAIVTAAAMQAAPNQASAIVQAVSQATGQSPAAVESAANQASAQAAAAVSISNAATQNVVSAPAPASPGTNTNAGDQTTTDPQVIDRPTTSRGA
jgi:hypothetical protein